jgi:hypothetical protein
MQIKNLSKDSIVYPDYFYWEGSGLNYAVLYVYLENDVPMYLYTENGTNNPESANRVGESGTLDSKPFSPTWEQLHIYPDRKKWDNVRGPVVKRESIVDRFVI